MGQDLLLEVKNLKKYFPVKRGAFFARQTLKAVDGVDIRLNKGDIYGLVGESGCGKSTVGRLIAGIIPKDGGDININTEFSEKYRQVQMIFQNAYGALNPRKKIGDTISEPLKRCFKYDKEQRLKTVHKIMEQTGLDDYLYKAYPHELSGGQRQRVNIAASLVLGAPLLIADESVSALDISIQSQILNLFLDLKESMGLTYIFISHDLNVIRYISSHIGVMYLGKIVESGPCSLVCENPVHPYTRMLLKSIPSVREKNMEKTAAIGELPDPLNPPEGCPFRPRCESAKSECAKTSPENIYSADGTRMARCLFAKF